MNEIASTSVDTALTELQSGVTSTLGGVALGVGEIVVACLAIWGIIYCAKRLPYWVG